MAPSRVAPNPLDHLQLSSGRQISYATYGSPLGRPVLLFHSFPGSRLEGALWHDAAAELNIRLIVPDRPGIALSSFQPGRRIVDWPTDVIELTAHLQIAQFHILSMGIGSAYTLACLRAISPQRILGASLVSGAYPLSLGAPDMMIRPRIMLFLARWLTSLFAFLVDLMLGRPARAKDPKAFEDALEIDHKSRAKIDQVSLQDQKFKAGYTASVRESFQNGGYGFAWDARLLGGDWGYELAEINGKRLMVWHGRYDNIHPISMAQRAAEKIEGVDFRALDEGHLSLPARHAKEILRELSEL